MNIKELREKTGQTQKEFAARFEIPLGTLRRWEYGESTPAPYIIKLISDSMPELKESIGKMERIGDHIYFDKETNTLIDSAGTRIHISEDIEGVKEQNLAIYVKDLFDAYNSAMERFYKDCRLDKNEDILWS